MSSFWNLWIIALTVANIALGFTLSPRRSRIGLELTDTGF